jgi:hypothetical protein
MKEIDSLDWSNSTCNERDNHRATKFMNTTLDLCLTQHIDKPTRFRQGHEPSKLDLLFTKFPETIDSITYDPPLGCSDHSVLCIVINTPWCTKSETNAP